MRKASRNRKKAKKNLTLAPDTIRAGLQMAADDHRDFSAQVSWLIDREFERRNKTVSA